MGGRGNTPFSGALCAKAALFRRREAAEKPGPLLPLLFFRKTKKRPPFSTERKKTSVAFSEIKDARTTFEPGLRSVLPLQADGRAPFFRKPVLRRFASTRGMRVHLTPMN